MSFKSYSDTWDNNLAIEKNIAKKSKEVVDDIFNRIGSSIRPPVVVVNIKKRGGYDHNRQGSKVEEIYGYNIFIKESTDKESSRFEKDLNQIIEIPENYILEVRYNFVDKCIKQFMREACPSLLEKYDFQRVKFNYSHHLLGLKEDDNDSVENPGEEVYTLLGFSSKCKKEINKSQLFRQILENIDGKLTDEIKPDVINNLLSSAGKQVLNDKIYRKHLGVGNEIEIANLYDIVHNISLLKYENTENSGRLLFAPKSTRMDSRIHLHNKISIIDYKSVILVRKLLETSKNGVSLLCENETIYGIGIIKDGQLPKNSFTIKFIGQGEWEALDEENHIIMRVSYGIPMLPKPPLDKESFFEKFKTTFGNEEVPEEVWKYVNEAIRQSHGTLVVITDEPTAYDQVDDLANQCFRTAEIAEVDDLIKNGMTAVDGAILIDNNGWCYAFGVILDGIASRNLGLISRGARFNSALRFLNKLNSIPGSKGMVVIVSEDKHVEAVTQNDIKLKTF